MRPWNWAFMFLLAFLSIIFLLTLSQKSLLYQFTPLIGPQNAPYVGLTVNAEPQFSTLPGEIISNQDTIVSHISEVPSTGGWINTVPLNVEQLQGKGNYILYEFWSYSDINSIRSTPYTEDLWNRYKEDGLVVIGVHTPTFDFEHNQVNVLNGVRELKITYPVLLDSNKVVSKSFDNHYLPGKYLVNPQGKVVWTQFGEGGYEELDELLGSRLGKTYGPTQKHKVFSDRRPSPELYATKSSDFGNVQKLVRGEVVEFSKIGYGLEQDSIYLNGEWYVGPNYVESRSKGKILVNYRGSEPYVVLSANETSVIRVMVRGKVPERSQLGSDAEWTNTGVAMDVRKPRLYSPLKMEYGWHIMDLEVPAGVRLYAITFGGY